jgi:hypothetical protein
MHYVLVLLQNLYHFLSLWLYSPLDLGRFFSFLILFTIGIAPWTGDQPVASLLSTSRRTHTQNKRGHPCLEWDSNPRSQCANSWQVGVTLRLTVSRSVSKSCCQAPSVDRDQIFITVWQLRPCFYAAPSLTRGRACLMYVLLGLASAVFLGSESLGTRHHILLTQI